MPTDPASGEQGASVPPPEASGPSEAAAATDLAPRRARLSDFTMPLLVFVFAAVVAYLTTTFDKASPAIVGDAMQPRNFPLFLVIVISVLNVIVIAQTWRNPPKPREPEPWQTWASVALLGLFFLIAFCADMFLGLAVVMFVMAVVWGEKRLWLAGLVAVATPAIIFFTFDLVLKVRFPRGILTNLWYGA
ncbi:MAG: tripartite tricarboxylate transporter TctB family protein [Pseudomonadota bacterium]